MLIAYPHRWSPSMDGGRLQVTHEWGVVNKYRYLFQRPVAAVRSAVASILCGQFAIGGFSLQESNCIASSLEPPGRKTAITWNFGEARRRRCLYALANFIAFRRVLCVCLALLLPNPTPPLLPPVNRQPAPTPPTKVGFLAPIAV